MIHKDEKGSIMLETVLVLPIFVLIVFFLIQITFVWTAKQMTYYAAYCGARAALVYNPADYHAEKQDDGSWQTNGYTRGGVVHHASCTVLSWISWSLDGTDDGNFKIGSLFNEMTDNSKGYSIPFSSNVRKQVTVEIREFEKIPDNGANGEGAAKSPASIQEQFPAVTVNVNFKCPLFIPLGGSIIAYFFGANDQVRILNDEDKKNIIGISGFSAPKGNDVHTNLQKHGNYVNTKRGHEYYMIDIRESCTMAKPYKTDTFPLMPRGDKEKLMGMME